MIVRNMAAEGSFEGPMKRRLLIVGASGFVGSRWALAADALFEIARALARHAAGRKCLGND